MGFYEKLDNMTLSCLDYQGFYAMIIAVIIKVIIIKQHRSISWLQSGEQQDHQSEGGYILGTMNGYSKFCDNFSNISQDIPTSTQVVLTNWSAQSMTLPSLELCL